ncbi:MAG: EAL domain-containing protein, partial [Bilifractor sp.]
MEEMHNSVDISAHPAETHSSNGEYVVSHIDEAVSSGWIVVYYQPIVRTLSNKICGMEALARWNDPERGMLPPIDFIGPLEDAQLIWKLDLCVIRQAVMQIAERSSRGVAEIPVSVNLSRMDFLCCDIFHEIETFVQTYNVPRRMLHIEVTESIMTSDHNAVLQALDHFRDAGYELWMDDFGSGYSTLNLLKDYTFDLLKLDMVFLRSDTARSRDIIASVIDMDKKIGIRTLAEGVETKEQAEFLKKSGCEKMQGYYFGKPQPFDEMLKKCVSRGMSIEGPGEKVCYDAVGRVNFRTDIPLCIVETRPDRARFLFMNDPALQQINKDGYSDVDELEKIINDLRNPASLELYKAAKYTVISWHAGEVSLAFHGQERLLRYRPLGRYQDVKIFSVNIYARTSGEEFSAKSRMLMNLLYFCRYIYSIDLDRRTVQSIRFTEASAGQSNAMPLCDADGGYSTLLPAVFPADRKRYDDFLNPDTMAERLKQAENGIITGVFRTQDAVGRFVPMSHRLLLVPNAVGRQILYAITMPDVDASASETASSYAALTEKSNGVRTEADVKAMLWDDLMLHIPLPLFWKDSDRRFLGASRYFLDYYGFSSMADILGKTDEDMAWHPNNEMYQTDEHEILKTGSIHINVPGRCTVDGTPRDILATKWPTYRDGKISGLMGYFLDDSIMSHGAGDAVHAAGPFAQSDFRTASQLMDDLIAYEADYELNRRNFGVIYFRIPGFTRISDDFGRHAMYAVAQACSEVIRQAVDHVGSAACVGIGQFAVVMPYVSTNELLDMARQIREGIEAIRQVGDVTCSLYAKVRVMYADEVIRIRKQLLQMNFDPADEASQADAADDTSGYKAAEENRALLTLMDAMPIGCYILRPDQKILYWNREAEKLLGFTASEMQGMKCVDMPLGCSFTNGDRIPGGSCPALVAFATGKAQSMQMFMRKKDGTDLLIRNTLVPLRDQNGKINELVSFFT